MRDQPSLRVDHVGMTTRTDLDLRDHVPDELEIDLGDAHTGSAADAGERQRHIRFGFATEIHRPVIDLVRHGLGELRLGGEVGAAADHVYRQARHAQALLARGIELGQFRNRRHLAQQALGIELALLDRAGRPRQLRRPAELSFDLPDELPHLSRRRFRLLALDADERCLVLLIVEEDLENAVGEQCHAHYRHEQGHILDE